MKKTTKKKPEIKKENDAISLVNEKLKLLIKKGIHYDLKEYPIKDGVRPNEYTLKMYFNGRTIIHTALGKKATRLLCYQEIIDRNII